ncbi:hypothetical protein AC579_2887 [Pseudocercospora musae]|uniref:NADP-dependent oxidoreductase domain-containing protein n=1 Tax=Pseudocercospora musae TaxID=113226 RepID=A0A139IUA6_9PEZI|nr:hypothetical protein AC579_2887 [Pseudocercospora musae]
MSLPKSFPIKVAGGETIDMPSVGFGTWAAGDTSWAKDSTLTALKEGYRHIDGAWMYGVDEAVGAAIKESGVPREQIFYTSKAWPHFFSPENVELCLDKVLQNTGLEYVDLFLVHWPFALKPISRRALEKSFSAPAASNEEKGILIDPLSGKSAIDYEHTSTPIGKKVGQHGSFLPTWKAMQELVRKGKARAIGVSNFSISDIEVLLDESRDIPISCNQVEVHPWLPQTELIEYCKKHNILVSCYSPFAGQKSDGKTLIKDNKVVELAKKNGMDAGQLLQSWAVQRGTVPLGKSQTPARIKSNLDVKKLSEEDVKTLDALAIPSDEGRTVNGHLMFGLPLFDKAGSAAHINDVQYQSKV